MPRSGGARASIACPPPNRRTTRPQPQRDDLVVEGEAVEDTPPHRPTKPLLTRDYFRVEDARGRRFWLFRHGLYDRETASPAWYVHGLFA